MNRRATVHTIVAIVGLGLSSTLGQAQEQQDQSDTTTTNENNSAQLLPVPLPVIVTEPEETANSRQSAEQEAAAREIADLVAQQGMNAATQRMADFASWQTWLIGIGTIVIIATLLLTLQANHAAIKSVQCQRAWVLFRKYDQIYIDTGTIETRDAKGVHVKPFQNGLGIKVVFENCGNSPAIDVESSTFHKVVKVTDPIPHFVGEDPYSNPSYPTPLAQQTIGVTPQRVIIDNELQALKSRELAFYVYVKIKYRDIFRPNLTRITEICGQVEYNGQVADHQGRRDNFTFTLVGPQNNAT